MFLGYLFILYNNCGLHVLSLSFPKVERDNKLHLLMSSAIQKCAGYIYILYYIHVLQVLGIHIYLHDHKDDVVTLLVKGDAITSPLKCQNMLYSSITYIL
jgi:hypothetical protein